MAHVQTSEMFFATGRFEVCAFGGVLVEHSAGRSADNAKIATSHIWVFSSEYKRGNELIFPANGESIMFEHGIVFGHVLRALKTKL